MAKRLVQTGFTVVPQLGVLDDEADTVTPAQIPPIQVMAGGLANFEANEWPAQMATVDTNKARVISGAPASVFPNKGEIVGGCLYFTSLGLDSPYPGDIGASVPQWLTSVDLTEVA